MATAAASVDLESQVGPQFRICSQLALVVEIIPPTEEPSYQLYTCSLQRGGNSALSRPPPRRRGRKETNEIKVCHIRTVREISALNQYLQFAIRGNSASLVVNQIICNEPGIFNKCISLSNLGNLPVRPVETLLQRIQAKEPGLLRKMQWTAAVPKSTALQFRTLLGHRLHSFRDQWAVTVAIQQTIDLLSEDSIFLQPPNKAISFFATMHDSAEPDFAKMIKFEMNLQNVMDNVHVENFCK